MTRATDDDIVEAIAEYFRDAKSAAVPCAWRIIVERLSEVYGTRIVDRAVHRYMRALQQEKKIARAAGRPGESGLDETAMTITAARPQKGRQAMAERELKDHIR